MGISQYYKTELQHRIEDLYSTNRKRRPMQIDIREGIDCLFRLVRTGMQWREVNIAAVSYITLFKHVHRWVDADLFQATYASLLARYATGHDQKYYIVDSSQRKQFHETTERNDSDCKDDERRAFLSQITSLSRM